MTLIILLKKLDSCIQKLDKSVAPNVVSFFIISNSKLIISY